MPRVVALVLLLLSSSSLLAETFGEQRLLPRPGAVSPVYRFSMAASDGTNFAVIAQRGTSEFTLSSYLHFLDRSGQRIGADVALRGGGFIGWAGVYFLFASNNIYRYTSGGRLLGTTPMPVEQRGVQQLVAGEGRLLVVTTAGSYFVDQNGVVTPGPQPVPSRYLVASNGSEFLYEVKAPDGTRSLRLVDAAGNLKLQAPYPALANFRVSEILSDGTTWALVDVNGSPHMALLDGQLQLARYIWRQSASADGRIGIRGRGYAGWTQQQHLLEPPYFVTISLFEAPNYDEREVRFSSMGRINVAASATALLVMRSAPVDQYNRLLDTYARLWIGEGPEDFESPADIFLPSISADRYSAHAATNDAGVTLVTWREPRDPASVTIRAARVSRSGQILDDQPIELGSGCPPASPRAGSDGYGFLVAWGNCDSVLFTTVDAAGIATPPGRLPAHEEGPGNHAIGSQGILFDGVHYLLLFQHAGELEYRMVRISPDGFQQSFVEDTKGTFSGAVERDGGYLAVYADWQTSAFYSVQLDQDLRPAAKPARIRTITTEGFMDVEDLRRVGNDYIAVTSDGRVRQFQRLSPEGAARGEAHSFATDNTHAYRPTVICDLTGCTYVSSESTAAGMRFIAYRATLSGTRELVVDGPLTIGTTTRPAGVGGGLIAFTGTIESPRTLIYNAVDMEGASQQLFVRQYSSRRRSVR